MSLIHDGACCCAAPVGDAGCPCCRPRPAAAATASVTASDAVPELSGGCAAGCRCGTGRLGESTSIGDGALAATAAGTAAPPRFFAGLASATGAAAPHLLAIPGEPHDAAAGAVRCEALAAAAVMARAATASTSAEAMAPACDVSPSIPLSSPSPSLPPESELPSPEGNADDRAVSRADRGGSRADPGADPATEEVPDSASFGMRG